MRIPRKKGKKKWDGFIPEIPGFGEAEERQEWKGCSLVLGPKIEGYSKVLAAEIEGYSQCLAPKT